MSLFIAGNWEKGDGPEIKSHCPATGTLIWSGRAASEMQVKRAAAYAREHFEQADWSLRPLSERVEILRQYAELVTKNASNLAELISRETGKPLWESKTEVAAMAGKVEISTQAQSQRAGEQDQDTAFGGALLRHRPHGLFAVLGPFNFPGHLPGGHIIPALLAGNHILFKPSELAPAVGETIVKLFLEAGVPAPALQLLQGDVPVGQALMGAPIDGLLFTGSAHTGKIIHKYFAGRPEILLALEMGGNNPLIVWEPAPMEAAADLVVHSAFITSGQRCSCARRLILPQGKFGDQIIEAVIARIKAMKIGPWSEKNCFIGPLIHAKAAAGALEFAEELKHKGGKILQKLMRDPAGEAFLRPGLMQMPNISDIPDREAFAPFLQVYRAATLNEAVQFANRTEFGLSAGFICEDETSWQAVHPRLHAGIVNWNRPVTGAASSMPFGGPGISGNHRPSAYYAADYCAWPQASQIAAQVEPMKIHGVTS